MTDLDSLQRRIGEWAARTFPEVNISSIIAHACEEMQELNGAFTREAIAEEAADVLLLLLSLAHRGGWSLAEAAERKFAQVQERRYAMDPERGYARHVDDDSDAA